MELYDVINARRDTRAEFIGDPVAEAVLTRLLSGAHTAPSVGMSQPWDFVVVRSPETRAAFREHVLAEPEVFATSLPPDRAPLATVVHEERYS